VPALIKGSGGNFIVRLDGEVLFSKKQTGRFPDPGEVEKLLVPRLAV
jgi:selenoprotein W-related protein